MAVNIYESYSVPASGERFRCISSSPEAYVMEWEVQPMGYVPFEHIHLAQDEIFHVHEGEVKLVIDGKEYIGRAGETVTVPKGAVHIAYNNTPGVLKCTVECRPGLDMYKVSQCFAGLVHNGDYDKKGKINIPKMGYFLKKMNCQSMTRPTEIPAFMFTTALYFFYFVGVIRGWDKEYRQYTEE